MTTADVALALYAALIVIAAICFGSVLVEGVDVLVRGLRARRARRERVELLARKQAAVARIRAHTSHAFESAMGEDFRAWEQEVQP